MKQNSVDKEKPEKAPRPSLFQRWRGSGQEWISLGIMAFALGVAIHCIEHSRWITPHPPLILIFGLGVLFGLITAKSRLPASAAFFISLLAGFMVTLWQSLELFTRFSLTETAQWTNDLQSLGQSLASGSLSTVPFAIFLTFSAWLMAYVSTWFLFRKQNAWVAVCLGTVAILVNLSNVSERHYMYFLLYFPAAGLLIGQVNLAKHYHQAGKKLMRFTIRTTVVFTASVLVASVLAISVSWSVPLDRANYLQNIITTRMPWQNMFDNLNVNIFASVPSKWRILESEEQQVLTFGEPKLGQEVLFLVTATRAPAYLRTRNYDVYHPWGWTNSTTDETLVPRNTLSTGTEPSNNRAETTYKVISKSKTDIILASGEFVSTDIPVTLHSMADGKDIITISTVHALKPNDTYTIRTGLSTATPEELSKTGQDYPAYILDYYLQLPYVNSRRITSISQIITRNANTPYDKAVAIVKFLSQYPYIKEGTAPSDGTDGVQHFLFTSRTGNCTDFASAMVVMLRSLGVPARISSGYILREADARTETYTVRGEDYHARPEVYFPGYGWIEFEATPIPDNANSGSIATGLATIPTDAQTDNQETANQADTSDNASDAGDTRIGDLLGFGRFIEWIDASLDASPLERSLTILLLIITAAVLVIVIAWVIVYRWLRRLKRADDPSEVFTKLCALGSLLKLSPDPHGTPLEYRATLVSAFPEYSEAIDNLTWAHLKTTYSPVKELGEAEKERLRQSWHFLLSAFMKCLVNNRLRFFRK